MPIQKPLRYKATTTLSKNLASKFNYFEFQTTEDFNFIPGQYINVIVAEHTFRAYSLATKDGNKKFGLLVDTRPGGPGSQFFERLKKNDEIEFLGPLGVFIIHPEDGAKNLLLLGTGSGISPLKCMVDYQLKTLSSEIPLYLYFGLTNNKEIFWKDYFEELEVKYKNFHFRFALLEPDNEWNGHKGYNTDLMKNDFQNTSDCGAYLCGHPAMIEGATNILLSTGCPKERIYKERFL
ncbi:MAG: FAD-binding oxidoreductase [Patescibacteria group bacterium]